VCANVQVLADVRNGNFEEDQLKNQIGEFTFSHGSEKEQSPISAWSWTGDVSGQKEETRANYFAYAKDELEKKGVATADGNAVMFRNEAQDNLGFLYQNIKVAPGKDLYLNFNSVGAIQYVVESLSSNLESLKSIDGANHNNYTSTTVGKPREENSGISLGEISKNQLFISGKYIEEDTLRVKFGAAGEQQGGIDNISVTQVPEPSSVALSGLGLCSLLLRRKR